MTGKKHALFFYILIRSWKSFSNFEKCIDSVYNQNYSNYKILFIDDASGLNHRQKLHIKNRLKGHTVVFNKTRRFSLFNAHYMISKYALHKEAVIFNLDGDDWLLRNALKTAVRVYQNNPDCLLTYGECLVWDGIKLSAKPARKLIPFINIKYSDKTITHKSYRTDPFRPLHPRTWRVSAFKSIPKKEFLDPQGNWLRFAEDMAIFFPLLEIANGKFEVIKKPIYVYNRANPHADVAENTLALLRDELIIRRKHLISKPKGNRNKIVFLFKHRSLSLAFFSDVFYKIQILLLEKRIIKNIFLSAKVNKNKKSLIVALNKVEESVTVVIKSSTLHPALKLIKHYKILDLPEINLSKMDTPALYNLMWTLLFSDAVTPRTRKVIANILPSDYPVVEI